ncbi:MAG: monooxygenase [Chloroflexota bacterium]
MADPAIEARTFRDTMGRFATGVTVVTVAHGDRLRGMTANSFTSLSLDPPLLLVCVDHHASMHELFQEADAFAVNILAADQQALSAFFASRGEKEGPMGGQPFRLGPAGSPILDGVMAWMDCRIEHRYDGGDHTIVVGRIQDMQVERPEASPLLFFSGKYHALGPTL